MLNYIGVGERAGSGVPNIYSIWEQEGFVEPTVDELSGREGTITTVVTLPLVKNEKSPVISEKQPEKKVKKSEEMARRMRDVLEAIKENPAISRTALAGKLKITDSQVRTALSKLKNNGTIRRSGSDTDGFWEIIEHRE